MAQPPGERGERQIAGYVDAETADRFAALARENQRSVSGELRVAITERLERAEREREASAA